MSENSMHKIPIEQIRKNLEGMSRVPDLTAADILALPVALKLFLRWIIMNRAVTCEQVAGFLGETEEEALSLLDTLASFELIERLPICGMPRYWVCLNPRRLRPPLELLNMSEE